jgi:hypothetical protein
VRPDRPFLHVLLANVRAPERPLLPGKSATVCTAARTSHGSAISDSTGSSRQSLGDPIRSLPGSRHSPNLTFPVFLQKNDCMRRLPLALLSLMLWLLVAGMSLRVAPGCYLSTWQ